MKKPARQLDREINEALVHGWEEEIRKLERAIAQKRRLLSNLATSRDTEDLGRVEHVGTQIDDLVKEIAALHARLQQKR